MGEEQLKEPQSLTPAYRLDLFIEMYQDLRIRSNVDTWYNTLNKARLLRLLIADDYNGQEGFYSLVQDVSDILKVDIQFEIKEMVSGNIRALSREEFLDELWGIIFYSKFTTIKIIHLLTNKLGGVHIEPIFERKNGKEYVKKLHKEKFADIEKAFSFKFGDTPALREWMNIIGRISIHALEPLYNEALKYQYPNGI